MNENVSLLLKAKMFRGFSDPTRLSILESLRDCEMSVKAIAKVTEQSQSNISNHLSCLKECGLVISRLDGKNVCYSIASPRVRGLLNDGDLVLGEIRDCIRSCARYGQ